MLWRFGVRDWTWMVYQAEYGLEFIFLGMLLAVLAVRLPRRPQVLFLMLAIMFYGLTPVPAMIDNWLQQEFFQNFTSAPPAFGRVRAAAAWLNPCVTLILFGAVWWCLVRAVFCTSCIPPVVSPAQETSDVAGPTRLVS